MWHLAMIWIHASAGVLGFFLGCYLAVRPHTARRRPWAVVTYVAFIAVLFLAMLAAVVIGWPESPTVQRIAFAGLCILGAYTLFRALQADHVRRHALPGWNRMFVKHVGFTLISLFDGFVIVAAIDLHAPPWLVPALAIGGVVAGISVVRRLESRATQTPHLPAEENTERRSTIVS